MQIKCHKRTFFLHQRILLADFRLEEEKNTKDNASFAASVFLFSVAHTVATPCANVHCYLKGYAE